MTEHRIEITSDFLRDGYQAECSCGWIGDRCETQPDALATARAHERELDIGADA